MVATSNPEREVTDCGWVDGLGLLLEGPMCMCVGARCRRVDGGRRLVTREDPAGKPPRRAHKAKAVQAAAWRMVRA